jgi:hypothetical protein
MDAMSEAKLDLVHPTLATKIRQLSVLFTSDQLRVIQGLRQWSDQAKLYAKGRTEPGNIVTNAPPGHSWHEFGLAVDVVPVSLLTTPNWSPESALWADLGAKGKSLDLFWGGDFHSIPDRPHFQFTGTLPVSPDNEVRTLYAGGGTQAVWKEAFPDAVDLDGEIAT